MYVINSQRNCMNNLTNKCLTAKRNVKSNICRQTINLNINEMNLRNAYFVKMSQININMQTGCY